MGEVLFDFLGLSGKRALLFTTARFPVMKDLWFENIGSTPRDDFFEREIFAEISRYCEKLGPEQL